MNEQTVLLVVSFHRYVKEIVQITELAYGQKAAVIILTDSRLAPIQPYSDLIFLIYALNHSTLYALTPLFSFYEYDCSGRFNKRKGII